MSNYRCRVLRGRAILLLVALFAVAAQTSAFSGPNCWDAIVSPGGWDLPLMNDAQVERPYKGEGYPANVTESPYGAIGQAWLPLYYVKDGKLVLRQVRCRFENLSKLQVEDRPFAVWGTAKGLDIGVAGDVWWVDRDGDGRFEEFQWVSGARPAIPEWVLHPS